MANNFTITQGSGTTLATEQGAGTEHYQKIKLIDPTAASTAAIGVSANPLRVDPTGTTPQPVTGTFFQATQPVSGTVTANAGTNTSTANLDVALSTRLKPADTLAGVTTVAAVTSVTNPVAVTQSGTWTVNPSSTLLCQSVTGASGAAVTATLPAVAAQFHYITGIEIVRYAAAALTASATPTVVTTTNLPGSLAFTIDTAGALGVSLVEKPVLTGLLKSSVVNTTTTVVCPATTGVIWRVNVFYFAAA